MGGYGYMGLGLKNLLKILLLVTLLFSFGCGTTETSQTNMKFNNYQTSHKYNSDIGKLQSKLVTLTVQCNKGSADACAKAEVFKKKLKVLLND